ncbi:MAG: hypothetical protein K8R99_13855 [Actinomycetia bacterium]|nr:hypothetical protein [Actinomycetes bacterium]
MNAPNCPNCGQPITRVVDVPYGWWEWTGDKYENRNAATRVDVAPWVHLDCMGELRKFHPQNPVTAETAGA